MIFLSGDDTACRELTQLVPEVTTVAVKRAVAQAAAETLHPARARARIRAAAAGALQQRDRIRPSVASGPIDVEVDLYRPHTVDLAALVPGVRRSAGARTVSFTAPDMAEAYRVVQLLVELGQIEPA